MHVEVRGVGFGFAKPLFDNLTFSAAAGRLTVIVGPSGSGKSTLLSLLAGWEKPSSGLIEREGIDTVSWVFQNAAGVPRRTALDHVSQPLLYRGVRRADAEKAARSHLARMRLTSQASRSFRSLSGGEAQRLMLARALALAPSLLLIDEPTAQLDRTTAREVADVLGELRAAPTVVVIASHDDAVIDMGDLVVDLGSWSG